MPTRTPRLRGSGRDFEDVHAADFAGAANSAARIRTENVTSARKITLQMAFCGWSKPCYRGTGKTLGRIQVAAYAGHALAISSEAAIFAGRPGAGAASAADSPFAAMLAQMMNGTSLQSAIAPGSTAANETTAGPPSSVSAVAQQFATAAQIVQSGFPSSAVELPTTVAASQAVSPPSSASAAVPPSQLSSGWQVPASAQSQMGATNATGVLPGRVPSYAQSLGAQPTSFSAASSSQLSMPPVPAALPASPTMYQPGASIAHASPPARTPSVTLPAAGLPSFAPPVAANSNSATSAQQAASSWLQQMMAANGTTSAPGAQSLQTSLQQSALTNLPAGLSSFAPAMSAPTSGLAGMLSANPSGNAPSTAQQPAQTLLQQMIAASARMTSSPAQSAPSPLPAGVSGYAQGINSGATQATGIPAVVAAAAQPPASQPIASASSGPWAVASTPSTILAADSTQSVAAMFGVPAFPSTMAYAASGAGKSQPSSASSTSEAASQFAASAKSVIAAGPVATSTPHIGPAMSSQTAQPTTTQQSATSGNQAPSQIAATTGDKAAALAQAAQNSVRQGHSAPVTEAQTLPLHFDLTDPKATSKQNDAGATDNGEDATSENDASAPSAPSSPSPAQAAAQHSPTAAPQAPALPTAAAPAATPSTIAGTQPPATTQQPLQTAATTPSASPPTPPLAAPDLNALALSIASKSVDGAKQFDIRLDPVELGRVDVRLSLDGNGSAQAHLAAERPETLALLQSNSGALTRALQDSGVQVANNGLQFSLKGQERQADGQQRAPARNRNSAVPGITAANALNAMSSSYGLSPAGEGVNILV
jgi:flagellar hook-length control protein FliK